ncbi:unnamed protein product [Diatraea saccharalis]|uniref:F-box domain-containing protein n=1 Tax=Diatraea saccharalis TaxID=40085 RepID=A0A9N9WMA9_9NEOP|nr:unnamed protein product [Diatraea saccharalis]
MDIQSSSRDLATPLSYKNLSFCKTEDSGYHTSFASPSLECSSLTNESPDPSLVLPNYCKIQVDCYPLSPRPDVRSTLTVCFNNRTNSPVSSENTSSSKRGIKRPYDDEGANDINSSVTTPTSVIANEVRKLKVHDNKLNSSITSYESGHIDTIISDIYYKDYYVSHPSTPIKKICKSSCNLSPFNRRKSARKVDFAIHSLSCERQVVKLESKTLSKAPKSISFAYKPNQKIDIIRLLYSHEDYCSSSIRKILSYLSKEDIYNFTLVSSIWCNIFKSTNTKLNCNNFFNNVKSNLENWDQLEVPRNDGSNQIKPLKEIQNFNITVSTPRSPVRSPRTTRFNKFTKAASLDDRIQLACVNCRHPAKITTETSGEEWVECTSSSCAYQFCRLCKCDRHPGKSCMQYDLIDGPSPSKRKKNICPVSSTKSKNKLKRLLF